MVAIWSRGEKLKGNSGNCTHNNSIDCDDKHNKVPGILATINLFWNYVTSILWFFSISAVHSF